MQLIMLISVFYLSADSAKIFLVDLYDRPHCAMGFSYYWFVLQVYVRIW